MQLSENLRDSKISTHEIILDLKSFIEKEEMNINSYELVSVETMKTKSNKNDMVFSNMKKKKNLVKGFSTDTKNSSSKVFNIFGDSFSTYDNIDIVNTKDSYENKTIKVFGCNFSKYKDLYISKPSELEFIGITIPMRKKNTLQQYSLHSLNDEILISDYFLFLNALNFEKQSEIHMKISEMLNTVKIAVK